MKLTKTSLSLTVLIVAATAIYSTSAGNFQEVMDVIEKKSEKLSQHHFFKYLADKSVPASKRLQFMPYWTFFSMAASDVLDNWIRVQNPQTELEYRINAFIAEDNWHYNFFVHDMDNVLKYTINDFGSYGAVLRHIWGDESKAVRMLVYTTTEVTRSKDPLVTLSSFEAMESGLNFLFESIYEHIFKEEEEFKSMQYFGVLHIDLERNHTITGSTLGSYDASEETRQLSLEIIEDIFYWYVLSLIILLLCKIHSEYYCSLVSRPISRFLLINGNDSFSMQH